MSGHWTRDHIGWYRNQRECSYGYHAPATAKPKPVRLEDMSEYELVNAARNGSFEAMAILRARG